MSTVPGVRGGDGQLFQQIGVAQAQGGVLSLGFEAGEAPFSRTNVE